MIRRPFNLKQWIADNRDLLKPPVGNKNLYHDAGDYIVMIVGGPNARKDYHFNETEELFYQLEGDIEIGIQEDGKAVGIPIKEGEMFLLPARVPHMPRRGANTVGLVIESKREDRNMEDGLQWYCENCNALLHEYRFVLHNIEKDFLPRFREFYASEEKRTCKKCGTVMEVDPRFASQQC
ncbi:MAG: 3-hydroxyanthranilate 3,4-dioxygenase [Flavobacteriales bacterium]|mgnify:FL=1|nr:3-hydroxyanthranilate 3,4-dioxygenase [Flavobacteriales bacterium]